MFNVLPDILKEEIRREYRLRKYFVTLALFICVQIALLIALFPSWIISVYREKDVATQSAILDQSLVSQNAKSVSSIIDTTNSKLSILDGTLSYAEVMPIFQTILSYKTAPIRITELYYTSTGTSSATITMRGVSDTREALVAFTKSLQKSDAFSSADLPISNLVKDKNIDFSLNLAVGQ